MIARIGILLLTALVCSATGCAALKDKTGEYIVEAVTEKVSKEIDERLNARGLSLLELRTLADTNGDNNVDMAEVRGTVRDMAKDFLALEGRNMVDGKVSELTAQFASRDDLSQGQKDFWIALISSLGALISTYLGKQVYSAKKDGKRDERLAVLEKILQKDLDGDGKIGGVEITDAVTA